MIKINLAKAVSYSENSPGNFFSLDFELVKEVFPAFLKMFILLFGIIGYEKVNLSFLNKEVKQKQVEKDQLDQKIKSYGDIGSVIEELVEKRKEMTVRVKVLNKISGRTKFKVKLLTDIQNSIHKDLWLTEIKFNKDNIFVKGYSYSNLAVQETAESFKKIKVVKSFKIGEIKKENNPSHKKQQMKFDIEIRLKETYVN